jgi:hypothetical protein
MLLDPHGVLPPGLPPGLPPAGKCGTRPGARVIGPIGNAATIMSSSATTNSSAGLCDMVAARGSRPLATHCLQDLPDISSQINRAAYQPGPPINRAADQPGPPSLDVCEQKGTSTVLFCSHLRVARLATSDLRLLWLQETGFGSPVQVPAPESQVSAHDVRLPVPAALAAP